MINTRRKKDTKPSKAPTPAKQRSFFKSEWPLLIYPVLIGATLALLYGVNRSIEKELLTVPGPTRATHRPAATDDPAGRAPSAPTSAGDRFEPPTDVSYDPDSQEPTPSGTPEVRPEPGRRLVDGRGGTPALNDRIPGGSGLSMPGDVNRVLVLLSDAAQRNDHARIKQCLDQLTALGDEAIVPLTEFISDEEGDAGLWAAEALARLGSPEATAALLDTLSQIHEGSYKEQLAKRASSISNHESWPVLLDTVQDTGDATVLRAASASLSTMADTPIVDEILARYEAATEQSEIDRLMQLVRSVSSPKATESMLALAGDVTSAPADALQEAAVEALGHIGDAQSLSYLLRKLETARPGEGTAAFNAVTKIDNQQAQAALLYAAAGNKEVSAEQGRTAAIHALANFPNEQTCTLLEEIIATEDNLSVQSAATRTLDAIRRTSPEVVANAAANPNPELMLQFSPLQK